MRTLKNTCRPKAVLLWLFVIVVIIFSVSGRGKSAEEIEISFVDLYQNRLIAENYVYKLTTYFSQKKLS